MDKDKVNQPAGRLHSLYFSIDRLRVNLTLLRKKPYRSEVTRIHGGKTMKVMIQGVFYMNWKMVSEDRRSTQMLMYRIYRPARQIKIPLIFLVRLEKLLTPLDWA